MIAWITTFPSPLWLATYGPNFALALHLTAVDRLLFGRDILFTYGPLGYLFYPIGLDPLLWIEALIFQTIVHTLFYFALLLFVLKSENRLFNGITIAIAGTIIEAAIQQAYLLAAVILLIAIYVIAEEHYYYFPLIAAVAAVAVFFKFDIGLACWATIILGIVYLAVKGYRGLVLMSLFSLTSVFIVAGLMLTQNVHTLISFLTGSYQIALGFAPAMSLPGPLWQSYAAIIAAFAVTAYLVHEVKNRNSPPFTILSLGFLFFSYKEGFVRQDLPHVIIFFGAWALFFWLAQIRERNEFVRKGCLLMLILLLVSSGVVVYADSPGTVVPSGTYTSTNLQEATYLISNPSISPKLFSSSVLYVREQYPLSSTTIEALSNHSADVFPWDVAITLAYGMKWDPRPVFHSYAVYTSYLDELNSRHFLSSNAPEFVLYRPLSIDNRYPLFDEPMTIRALMCNYEVIGFDGGFMLLHKVGNHCGPPIVIQNIESTFDRTISVPSNYSGYLFAEVHIQYNVIGTLGNLLYKAPPVYVTLSFADASTKTHLLVIGNAMDGLIVSTIPNSLFGNETKQIREISFTTPDTYEFDAHILITFVRVPVSQDLEDLITSSYPIGQTNGQPVVSYLRVQAKIHISTTSPLS